jgi:hypothetical protein
LAAAQPPEPSPDVTPRQVTATLERAISHFAGKSDEERLSELEKQAARLEKIASEQSVDEIAVKVRDWMHTPERAGHPAAAVDGEFDFDTAQIHEVLRTGASDRYTYHAVLVDAHGRTFKVEMTAAEGQRAYATLQSLKSFPLADKVYRQIAMPLIDRALQNSEGAARPLPNAPASNVGQALDDRDPFDESSP